MKLLQNNTYQIFNNSICTLNSKDVNKKSIFFDPITSPEYLFEYGFLVETKRIFFIFF